MTKHINQHLGSHIKSAQIVLSCQDFDETLAFFTEKLDFRVETIFPADAPSTAVISGYGVSLRLETRDEISPVTLRLFCDISGLPAGTPTEFIAPNGVLVELVEATAPINLPKGKQEFVLSRMNDESVWGVGRAGMQYRDLIPNRLGGRFIASHIRIPNGGEVPDYVHYHRVLFQMIFCKKGWAKLVYENQGEPFILYAGDCVLQPPEIRHRVLNASPGLEVIEISCPAIHETFADHNLQLPTAQVLSERIFNGQRFVHHTTNQAEWKQSKFIGFSEKDTGISEATDGLAEVRVLRNDTAALISNRHSGEFLFYFVLCGEINLESQEFGNHQLTAGDSCVIPAGVDYSLVADKGLEILEVFLPTLE